MAGKITFILVSALFLVAAAPSAPITVIQKRYEEMAKEKRAIKARFHQTVESRRFSPRESQGEVLIKFPGKMRWQYQKPTEKLFINDGEKTFIYEKGDSQIVEGKTQGSNFAIGFLWGEGKIAELFKIGEVKDGEQSLQATLFPKGEAMGVDQVDITYRKDIQLVDKVVVRDKLGNTNTMRFSKIKILKKLADREITRGLPKDLPVTPVGVR